MKRVISIIFLFFLFNSWGQLKIDINPLNPVKEESFNVIFEIITELDEEPFVSFDPVGVEVLGRRKEVSLSTSIINGKFSSTKRIKLVYEMISEKVGTARLTNIKVDIGSQSLTHKPVRIKILGKKKTPRNIFLKAEVSKTEAYIGEGIDVKYYLYSRAPIVQTEFKTFPKLNGFIKRFHKVDDREEALEYEGAVYRRSLKYSARVYPEKTGTVFIDPLRLNVQYAGGSGNPFGSFGLSFNRFKSKGVSSPKVKINILPLPTEGIPINFTGLVGEHEFRLISTKQKYVVNEAIEAKLEVVGPGALEKMEAPAIYKDPALEQFDTKGEFFEVGTTSGRKVFDYTYLARANVTIPQRDILIAYFDPESKEYKEKSLSISGLIIGGGGGQVSNPLDSTGNGNTQNEVDNTSNTVKDITFGNVAPLFTETWKSIPLNWHKWVAISLIIVIFIQLTELLARYGKGRSTKGEAEELIKTLRKKGLDYSTLSRLLYMLNRNPENKTIKEIVEKSNLNNNEKSYFVDLLDALERKNFSYDKAKKKKVRFKASAFKSLKKELSNAGI